MTRHLPRQLAAAPSASLARRVRSYLRTHGFRAALLAAIETLLRPVARHSRRVIWEADLSGERPLASWAHGEQLRIVSSGNLEQEMTPALRSFLGGDQANGEIEGVRRRDYLFVLTDGPAYLAYSYIFLDSTKETRRQARILDEPGNTPIIGQSFTAPHARGRGLYGKLLHEMFRFLAREGYRRAVCEIHPDNLPSGRASRRAGMRPVRELNDCIVLGRILLQKVSEGGRSRWRMRWVS